MLIHKYDIINGFVRARGLSRYLEICTPTTGVRFGQIDGEALAVVHRLMYRCPETYDDGLSLTFRTAAEGSQDLVRAVHALLPAEHRYDIIFVDPWHSYASSMADLQGALLLLRPGGIIVAHDCNPVDPATVGAEYRPDAWCGLTYQAFIDFVLSVEHASYCVVPDDYGCGVVFTKGAATPPGLHAGRPAQQLIFEWSLAREAPETRYAFFDRNRAALLNLVPTVAFLDACTIPLPAPPSPALELLAGADGPDPWLRLVAGGRDVPLEAYDAGWHQYLLPPGARAVRLVSGTFLPARHGVPDPRALGLAVAGLRVDGRAINLAESMLTDGWHSEEAVAGYPWRWTDGDATMRLGPDASVLEVFTTCRRPAPEKVEQGGPSPMVRDAAACPAERRAGPR